MSMITISALFIVSMTIFGVFVFTWVAEIVRRRDYVNRIIQERRGDLSKADKTDLSATFRRLLGLNKSSVEMAIEKLKREQSAEINKRLNPSLAEKLQRSDTKISVRGFYVLSIILFFFAFAVGELYKLKTIINLPLSIFVSYFFPRLTLSIIYRKRLKKFTQEFPNAIDVLVRGLRSGLPLVDCLRIISQESQDPVASEFKKVMNDHALGMPTSDAILKLAERVPTTEVNFLAIVIKIQGRTGGSLTEALENLSTTLRERRKLRDKVRAMSQEAKSSAAIIGAMPFLVSFGLYIFSPEYIELLFTETAGRIALSLSGVWMIFGILIMRKMIDFEV